MKYVVRKAYWDYEKEEAWINQMSGKGMALIDYSWCRYVFEDCKNGEYIYRIELLENLPSHPESNAYIRFIEETGAECVATYIRWVYFRKKAADGPFEIYSDKDSMIIHLKRINALWTALSIFEIFIGVFNILIGVGNRINDNHYGAVNISMGLLALTVGALLIAFSSRTRKKIQKLRREKMINE